MRTLEELRIKAEQGDSDAQFDLANSYHAGEGAPQNDAEAAKWLRMAAERGHALARFVLGVMYQEGRGVPQNDEQAVKWLGMAAEQGNTEAQFGLAVMYDNGQSVPQDYVQAHMWTNLAASSGAFEKFAKELRETLAQQMTSAQIAEAQHLARDWKPKTWDELKKGLETNSR